MGAMSDLHIDKAEQIAKITGLSFEDVNRIYHAFEPATDRQWIFYATNYKEITDRFDDYILEKRVAPINSALAGRSFLQPCINCSNNPENGGSGICHCILGGPKIT